MKLLLNSAEAAEALSISERKLWELQKSGQIPSVRIGRLVRFDVEALRAWIAKQSESKSPN